MGAIKNFLPSKIYNFLYELYQDYIVLSEKSYSGEGEDLILRKVFQKNTGFYIDIGCYHPKTYSNTYFFYKKGWNGLNIDANFSTIKKFERFRKRDININCGVSNENTILTYYMCDVPACNTFSKDVMQERLSSTNIKLLEEKIVQVRTLAEILDSSLPKNQEIDFMDIDVEGLDLEVLQSNNWEKYRPKVILVEEFERNLDSIENDSPIFRFLSDRNYKMVAKTFSTFIFVNKQISL